jgi:hypothetical protein
MRHAQCYIVKAPPLMVRLFKAGSLVINSPGTRHAVVSDEGCILLAIYEKPVRFLDNG